MGLKLSALRPLIGSVVMINITKQEIRIGFMNDDPQVPSGPYRPEILIFRSFDTMELQSRVGGIDLQVKCSVFDERLLIVR
jgi:hypothetical protein